jgi:hypothetical protein
VVWIGNPEPTVSAKQPVLLAKQITCCDAIVGSVLNFDAMKQGSWEIHPAIDLPPQRSRRFQSSVAAKESTGVRKKPPTANSRIIFIFIVNVP